MLKPKMHKLVSHEEAGESWLHFKHLEFHSEHVNVKLV